MMRLNLALMIFLAGMLSPAVLQGAENLKLNPKLDYSSDSEDGPLITGDKMEEGLQAGKPNYVIFYGEG